MNTMKLPALELTKQQTRSLQEIVLSKDEPRSAVVRARVLLRYARGETVRVIAQRENITRPTVQLCIEKALSAGISAAVRDLARPGRPALVTDDDRQWVLNLATSRPSDYGYHSQTWSLTQLTTHVLKHARSTGHPSLQRASKYIIRSILYESAPPIHHVSLSRRVSQYGTPTASLLTLSKEINLVLRAKPNNSAAQKQASSSLVQRPSSIPESESVPNLTVESGRVSLRFKELNGESVITMRLLAGVDLSDGRMITRVQNLKTENPFIGFLKQVDSVYPSDWRIRMIPGSFSAAASRENIKALKLFPNRFEFEEICRDWPLARFIDAFFTRMLTALLRSMHVESEDQFIQRFNGWLEDVNVFSAGRLTAQPINKELSIA